MSIKKTIGGDRIGSGSKMKTTMHGYGRANFNLSESFISSIAPGTLIPFYCNIGLNGDVFDFDLNAMCRTIPTTAPLFGSFKLQADLFSIPIRLYQAILHNNPINIGMKMNEVLLPKLRLKTRGDIDNTLVQERDLANKQIATNSLLRYLGISGIASLNGTQIGEIQRKFNALPALAYYDIFKNYYANKQEDNAKIIVSSEENTLSEKQIQLAVLYENPSILTSNRYNSVLSTTKNQATITYTGQTRPNFAIALSLQENRVIEQLDNINIKIGNNTAHTINWYIKNGYLVIDKNILYKDNDNIYYLIFGTGQKEYTINQNDNVVISLLKTAYINDSISITDFPLKNIDKMRKEILSYSELGSEFIIGDAETDKGQYLPYSALYEKISGLTKNAAPLNGIVLKTYQSDIFNNWLNTDWIDGENGINEITAVDITDGKLTMDALNLAQKVYNMLNRIALAGGTFDDWQQAVYGMEQIRKSETPIYLGGMSSEIVFEEIVATADSETADGTTKLGSLAGKGNLLNRKGGNVHVKITEPSIIMGLVSITPRLCYTQGNMWYNTELISLDDLHKPALDAIGYQELITEQMHWAATSYNVISHQFTRSSIGKLPAWINYQTAFNKAYGDFADSKKAMYMVLARNYEIENENNVPAIADATTYIDPTKYNYAFAYNKLDAQNFWVQIVSSIHARRVMSAKIIPNL